jgi:hypothetical protein
MNFSFGDPVLLRIKITAINTFLVQCVTMGSVLSSSGSMATAGSDTYSEPQIRTRRGNVGLHGNRQAVVTQNVRGIHIM